MERLCSSIHKVWLGLLPGFNLQDGKRAHNKSTAEGNAVNHWAVKPHRKDGCSSVSVGFIFGPKIWEHLRGLLKVPNTSLPVLMRAPPAGKQSSESSGVRLYKAVEGFLPRPAALLQSAPRLSSLFRAQLEPQLLHWQTEGGGRERERWQWMSFKAQTPTALTPALLPAFCCN